ncbi:MAG: hypothetical protein BM485_14420 [Desulfobulbaceae bacterium DB1]|nr:MAG: hypothetical protein BM485_14420 [Desulfobulbaceae bacterium DB1]
MHIANVSDTTLNSHNGFISMKNFVLDEDNDGVTDTADSCPSTPSDETLYAKSHGCSDEQFGQMVPTLISPIENEMVFVGNSDSGWQETKYSWLALKAPLGSLDEKYCLTIEEDIAYGGRTIWDECNETATDSLTLPEPPYANGELGRNKRYLWTVRAYNNYWDETRGEQVSWMSGTPVKRSFATYSTLRELSLLYAKEDYYDESLQYQSGL